jgi:O-antigen ligase
VVRKPAHLVLLFLATGAGALVSLSEIGRDVLNFYRSGAAQQIAGMVAYADEARYYGKWGEANTMAMSLMPVVALCAAILRTRMRLSLRALGGIGMFASALAVLMSLSRGGMICLALLITALVIAEKKYRWHLIGVTLAAVILAANVLPVNIFGRLSTLMSLKSDASVGQRTQLFLAGVRMIEDSFPLGVGAGNFRAYSMDYSKGLTFGMISHDAYIQVASETGPIGIILVVGLLAAAYRSVRPTRFRLNSNDFSRNVRVCLTASVAAISVSFFSFNGTTIPTVWIILSICGVIPHVFSQPEESSAVA